MTRKDKAAYNYARERLDNDDYPVYSDEYELELAFDAGIEYADAHPNWEAIVKRLQEEITNDLRQDRWISVEDELPKNGDCVLIYSKYGYMDVSIYNNGEWDCGRRGSEYLQNQVTHWMPLPSIEHLKEKE